MPDCGEQAREAAALVEWIHEQVWSLHCSPHVEMVNLVQDAILSRAATTAQQMICKPNALLWLPLPGVCEL